MHGCQIHEQERTRHSYDQIIVGGRSTNCSICLILTDGINEHLNDGLNDGLNIESVIC